MIDGTIYNTVCGGGGIGVHNTVKLAPGKALQSTLLSIHTLP
jgi:hypothetical protein